MININESKKTEGLALTKVEAKNIAGDVFIYGIVEGEDKIAYCYLNASGKYERVEALYTFLLGEGFKTLKFLSSNNQPMVNDNPINLTTISKRTIGDIKLRHEIMAASGKSYNDTLSILKSRRGESGRGVVIKPSMPLISIEGERLTAKWESGLNASLNRAGEITLTLTPNNDGYHAKNCIAQLLEIRDGLVLEAKPEALKYLNNERVKVYLPNVKYEIIMERVKAMDKIERAGEIAKALIIADKIEYMMDIGEALIVDESVEAFKAWRAGEPESRRAGEPEA